MATQQIVIVDVDRGCVSYDLYEVREIDHRAHGVVIDDEPVESVVDRLDAYFGTRAIVARRISRPRGDVLHEANAAGLDPNATVAFAGIERRGS